MKASIFKSKWFWIALAGVVAVAVTVGIVIAVVNRDDGLGDKTVFDNETDPLVFSTLEVDKVFNPFFSTSATDSNVVGLTQIGMLGNDKNGNPVWGDDEAVVTRDLAIVSNGLSGEAEETTYYFVLKNNVRFSNGTYLTVKDVLFNLYVYLDPAYTGSSTIYSTDIVGLKEYRTQAATEVEQDSYMVQFQIAAQARIDALVEAAENILDDDSSLANDNDAFEVKLAAYARDNGDTYAHVAEDYQKARALFLEELESDYSNSLNQFEETKFFDKEGNLCPDAKLISDAEMFLYNEGWITWSKKDAELSYKAGPKDKVWTKEEAIDFVFNANLPGKTGEVVQYWATAGNLFSYLTNKEMEEDAKTATKTYKNISGIAFANRTAPVTVNGVEYAPPTYAEDGHVTAGNEVLAITIHKVDPKAIWNFAFAVAPMYYYSDAEHIAAFDFEENFGVEYKSTTFMENVVKSDDKVGVPVGAGPYAASKSSGGLENITAGDFYSQGVIYFERNPYYVMGPATIKKVRYQVVGSSQMLNSLYSGEIDFAEPNAKPETISELDGKKAQGIGNKTVQTSGYGYIGINAGKVPDMKVRQAIMHAINTQECVEYYKTTAKAIYRSMSMANWAYPDAATAYYPYVGGPIPADLSKVNPDYADFVRAKGKTAGQTFSAAEQKEFLTSLVEDAGYSLNGDGVYQKGDKTLKYTFTVAGEETDHPAWKALWHAGELLNGCGFDIFVTTDANALKKLSNGSLTVWAAAWGSTIDPDMYQVYHMDSTATSTLNWGYKQIKQNVGNKYDEELALITDLSKIIEDARTTNDQARRKNLYAQALDIVMQLAVELPTYQRDDLFAYNTDKLDVGSLTPDSELSPYKGLTSDIHRVSLNTER